MTMMTMTGVFENSPWEKTMSCGLSWQYEVHIVNIWKGITISIISGAWISSSSHRSSKGEYQLHHTPPPYCDFMKKLIHKPIFWMRRFRTIQRALMISNSTLARFRWACSHTIPGSASLLNIWCKTVQVVCSNITNWQKVQDGICVFFPFFRSPVIIISGWKDKSHSTNSTSCLRCWQTLLVPLQRVREVTRTGNDQLLESESILKMRNCWDHEWLQGVDQRTGGTRPCDQAYCKHQSR